MPILDMRTLARRLAVRQSSWRLGRIPSVEAVSAALFFLVIWAPLVARMMSRGAPDPKLESRRLEPLPQPRLPWESKTDRLASEWKFFPAEFERHFTDHFPYRQDVAALSNTLLRGIGHSPEPMVYPGKDGWLFYRGERSLEQYRRTPVAPELENEWDEFTQELNEWVSQRGAKLVVVVCPNKETVYPEQMPDRYVVVEDRPHVTDRFVDRFHQSQIDVVDLRSVLKDAKDDGPVFYRLDTHWNSRGRFVAYQAIANFLGQSFPAIVPCPESRVRQVSITAPYHDLATMLLLPDRETEREYQPLELFRGQKIVAQIMNDPRTMTQYRVDDPSLPTAVVIHDSFFLFLDSWLKEHFSQSGWTIWKPDPRPEWFEAFDPQMVIYQLVERKLMLPPPTLNYLHESEFRRCPTLVFNTPPDPGQFRPRAGATITKRRSQALLLRGVFSVQLPPSAPASHRSVLRWEIESGGSGKLVVSYRMAGSETTQRATRRFLGARTSLYIALPQDVDWQSVEVEFHSEHPGGVTLHALECRSD